MTIPDNITGIRHTIINEILACLRAMQQLNSTTIRHEWTTNGVASHVRRQNDLPPNRDWEHTIHGAKVDVGKGYVVNQYGTWECAGATDLVITGDGLVVWRCARAAIGAGEVLFLATLPDASETTYLYVPLSKMKLIATNDAIVERECRRTSIVFPAIL